MKFLFYNKAHKTDKKLSNTNALKPKGYVILDHISNGSYGEVRHAKYRNEDNELNLVVKIIDTEKTSREYFSKFLPRELDVIRTINHPYIIHTHSILQKKAVLFIFMAYAEKGDIFQYINDHGALKENQARIWFRHLALAVQYLHTMDIIHRDIKCENVLITNNFTIKLADFSFSKFVDRSKRLNCTTHCYSAYSASPEILSKQPYDGKSSDIWSLGIVLFIMINKKIPFSFANVKIMYKQQVKRKWSHQPSIEKLLSENLKICINNILQPEPRKRWTIDKILESDWIKMNRRLVKMTKQESLALVEAIDTKNKILNQKHFVKIEANTSDIQQILKKQSPTFLSIARSTESIHDESIENVGTYSSIHKLERSERIINANNRILSTTNNDLTVI